MKTWLKYGLIGESIGVVIFWILMINNALKWGSFSCGFNASSCSFIEWIGIGHWIIALIVFGLPGFILLSIIGLIISKFKAK